MLKNTALCSFLVLLSNFLIVSLHSSSSIAMSDDDRAVIAAARYNELVHYDSRWNPNSGNRGRSILATVRDLVISPATQAFKCITQPGKKCRSQLPEVSIVLVNVGMKAHCAFIHQEGFAQVGYNQLMRIFSDLDYQAVEPYLEISKTFEPVCIEVQLVPIPFPSGASQQQIVLVEVPMPDIGKLVSVPNPANLKK